MKTEVRGEISPSPQPSPRGRAGNAFNLARLRSLLRPFRLHWYSRLGSTNTQAAKLRRERKLFAPAIVLTGRQLTGRGRGNNSWWSAAGCLTAHSCQVSLRVAAGRSVLARGGPKTIAPRTGGLIEFTRQVLKKDQHCPCIPRLQLCLSRTLASRPRLRQGRQLLKLL